MRAMFATLPKTDKRYYPQTAQEIKQAIDARRRELWAFTDAIYAAIDKGDKLTANMLLKQQKRLFSRLMRNRREDIGSHSAAS